MDGGMNIRMRKKDWLILGGKLATRIVKDTDKGISQDKDGKKFKPYNKEYAIKKKQRKVLSKGPAVSNQINPVNLRLTGAMLASIKARNATNDSVEIFYGDGEKINGHRNPPKRFNKPKRNIVGLNDKNQRFVKKYIEDIIGEKIQDFEATVEEINLGI